MHRDPEKVESLKTITAPFMLRRLKTDSNVIKDLPEKTVENMYCSLTTKQAALYEVREYISCEKQMHGRHLL